MSAIKSSVERNKGEERNVPPPPSIADQIYKFLSSIKFTIFLLGFIAVSSIFGTVIKQQAAPQEYLAQFSESTYAVLRFLGLTDVFHSRWFLLVIGLLVLNLIFCTADRFTRFLKGSKEVRLPNEKSLAALSLTFMAKGKQLQEVADAFKGYRQAASEERGRVLEKGSISRYGVYTIHASIIIILIGSVIGLLFGYRGSLILNQGETKDAIVARGARERTIPLGFGVKLDDFKVSFYPGGEPKEYLSRVQIIDKGKSVLKADVKVNHPLTYKGTSIYQASYGSNPLLLFNIAGQEVRLSQGNAFTKDGLTLMIVRVEQQVHNFGPGVQVAYLDGNQPQVVWFLKDVPRLRERDIKGIPVKLIDMGQEFYTGLEVARDPGVWVVWLGFAMILFGLYINFFMYYRRIYLLQTTEGVLVAGTSPRNKEAFREEFEKWRGKVNDKQ